MSRIFKVEPSVFEVPNNVNKSDFVGAACSPSVPWADREILLRGRRALTDQRHHPATSSCASRWRSARS